MLLVGVIALGSAGCHRAFTCEDDTQCVSRGVQGRCEALGFCSFPDSDCDSGRRYSEHAAAELVLTCVDASEDASEDASTTDPTGDEGTSTTSGIPGDCSMLVDSGPVVVEADGQVVQNLRITADGVPAIVVTGHRDVVIRDCEIHHRNAPGISFLAADGILIEDVAVIHDRTEPGPHAHGDQANISGRDSAEVVVQRVRVTRGASGIDLERTPGAHLSFIEGHDVRGPGPASFVRLHDSDAATLEDFSIVNPPDTGRPLDLIEISESSGVEVRRGLLDGNNSEFGYGVVFEQTAGQHEGGWVEDVDAVRMTNGSFSAFPYASGIVWSRTRARDNICEILSVEVPGCRTVGEQGGCVPGSGGRSWTGSQMLGPDARHDIRESTYFGLCFDPVWPESAFLSCDGDTSSLPPGDCGLEAEDFEPRAPIELSMCWEGG